MENKLYKMMNWPEIESIIYSECNHPHELLGKHSCQGGSLIQAFFPGAKKASIKMASSSLKFEMEMVDEEGYFAYWTNEKDIPDYVYEVVYDDETRIVPECYGVLPKPDKSVFEKLYSGVLYDMYKYFGAKVTEIKGVRGCLFTVYAPMAERVSVIGDFNKWDGRVNQMSRLGENGVFAIFIPNLLSGELYKYEIKLHNGLTYVKRDPFAYSFEKGSGSACVITDNDYFPWSDTKYMAAFKGLNSRENPLLIGDIFLKDFCGVRKTEKGICDSIIKYVKDKKITALTIENLSVYKNKVVCNEGVLSLFAINDEYIEPGLLKKIINSLHNNNIPVFFSLDLSSFLPDDEGLKGFDGRKLFEAEDDRTINGSISFNFSNKFVRNYLISAAFYYIKEFHADGLVLNGTDRILYLNYGKADGDFVPNIYGGPENPDGEELIKHLNSILHKKNPEIVTIAANSLNSNLLTSLLDENGFGFDYKLSNNFYISLNNYMFADVYDRHNNSNDLTNTSLNAYCEEFILTLPKEIYGSDEMKLLELLPGSYEEKIRDIKMILCTLFFGPDSKSIPFTEFKDPGLDELLKALADLYLSEKAFYELSDSPSGFEWIDAIDATNSTISFKRKGRSEEIVVIANFSEFDADAELYVDDKSSYYEILDSEEIRFGGMYTLNNKKLKAAKATKVSKTSKKKPALVITLSPRSYKLIKKII